MPVLTIRLSTGACHRQHPGNEGWIRTGHADFSISYVTDMPDL